MTSAAPGVFCRMTITLSHRKREIVSQYMSELDKHIADLKAGNTDRAKEIRDFASILHIHPAHLSNTVKEVTGQSTCDIYENRLLDVSKELLLTTDMSIARIAAQLTYDPSNFTKFFKAFTGITPKAFRNSNR